MQHNGNFSAHRAALAPPFFLIIVDYDTRRFVCEGPTNDIEPWDNEVVRIRRAGRDVNLFPMELSALRRASEWFRGSGLEEWPSRSIVEIPSVERPVAEGEMPDTVDFSVTSDGSNRKSLIKKKIRRRRRLRSERHQVERAADI